jgi:hypothetical protein
MVAPRTWDPNLLCIVPGRSFRSRGRGRRQRRSDNLGIGHSTRLVGIHAPTFEFNPLTPAEIDAMKIFLLFGLLLLFAAECWRDLTSLRDR